MKPDPDNNHWLVRPRTIRQLSIISCILLAIIVAAQSVIKVKGYFTVDGWFAFGAVFGFLCCVAMVLVAKVMGKFLKREENFYDD